MAVRLRENIRPQTPRLLVLDAQALFRACLRKALEAGGEFAVGAELGSGDGILEQVRSSRPDVIVLDLDMPGVDGHDALRALAANSVECPALVLTAVEDRDALLLALELGARGIVLKRSGVDELKRALQEIAAGGAWITSSLPGLRPSGGPRQDGLPLGAASRKGARPSRIERWTAPPWSRLTPRERQIAGLVADGIRYAEVAARLKISEQTVKNHVRHIFDKLEVTNRLQLALFVVNRKTG